MTEPPWSRYEGVRWDHVDWLFDHPQDINRQRPSREEEIALKRVLAGDRLALPGGDWPVGPPPLERFDRPQHSRPTPNTCDCASRWHAGFRDPPGPEGLCEYLLARSMDGYPDAHPRAALYNLFGCMAPVDMLELRTAESLTMHELVRALHHSGVRRTCLVRRLAPYADPPLRPRYLDAIERESRR